MGVGVSAVDSRCTMAMVLTLQGITWGLVPRSKPTLPHQMRLLLVEGSVPRALHMEHPPQLLGHTPLAWLGRAMPPQAATCQLQEVGIKTWAATKPSTGYRMQMRSRWISPAEPTLAKL